MSVMAYLDFSCLAEGLVQHDKEQRLITVLKRPTGFSWLSEAAEILLLMRLCVGFRISQH